MGPIRAILGAKEQYWKGAQMAEAKRHFIKGHIWHINHRCHKGEFLLWFRLLVQRLAQ